MSILDPSLIWKAIEERERRTTDPRHKLMLQTVIEHGKAEARGDIDVILNTLVPEPEYHFWSDGHDYGPKGMTEVLDFYEQLVGSGSGYLESPKERIVVDNDNVVTEMTVRRVFSGTVARSNGYDVDDEDAFYLISFRAVNFWPFSEDCKLLGEDSYISRDLADIQKVDDSDVPGFLREIVAANAGHAIHVPYGPPSSNG
jgi:hypothetical protein